MPAKKASRSPKPIRLFPERRLSSTGPGLGIVVPDEAKWATVTGVKYGGPELNAPNSPVDAIAGGKTANVLFSG